MRAYLSFFETRVYEDVPYSEGLNIILISTDRKAAIKSAKEHYLKFKKEETEIGYYDWKWDDDELCAENDEREYLYRWSIKEVDINEGENS